MPIPQETENVETPKFPNGVFPEEEKRDTPLPTPRLSTEGQRIVDEIYRRRTDYIKKEHAALYQKQFQPKQPEPKRNIANQLNIPEPQEAATSQIGLPKGYKGGRLGPSGEALPKGAIAFSATGEPYFGSEYEPGIFNEIKSSFLNWYMGTKYRLSEVEGGESKYLGAVAKEMIGTVLGVASIPANIAERVIGTTSKLHLQGIKGYGTPTDFSKSITNKYQSGLEGEKFSLDEAWVSSKLSYEGWVEPALQSELIRRYHAGEDPYLLTIEMQQKAGTKAGLTDFAGQMIFDPLNLLGMGIFKGAAKTDDAVDAVRGATKIADFTSVSKNSKVASVAKLGTALDEFDNTKDVVVGSKKLLDALLPRIDEVEATTTKIARDLRIIAPTAESKAAVLGEIATDVITKVAPSLGDDLAQTLVDLAVLSRKAGSESDLLLAAGRIAKQPARRVLLSEAGLRTGQAIGDFLTPTGKLSQNGMNSLMEAVTNAKNAEVPLQALVEGLAPILRNTLDNTFPSVDKQIKNVEKIKKLIEEGKPIPSYLARFVDNGNVIEPSKFVQKMASSNIKARKVVNPINQFLASIYMGISPAYALRNLQTNLVHMLVDAPSSIPGLFHYKTSIEKLDKWGAKAVSASRQIGAGGPASSDLSKSKNVFSTFSRLSGKIEERCGTAIYSKAFEKEMQTGIEVAIRDLKKEFSTAGMGEVEVRQIKTLLWDNFGDVDKTINQFIKGETKSLSFLPDDQLKVLKEYKLYDPLLDALKSSSTDVEFNNKAEKILKEFADTGLKAAKEEAVPSSKHYLDILEKSSDNLSKNKYADDLFARRLSVTEHTLEEYDRALVDAVDKIKMQFAYEQNAQGIAEINNTIGQMRTALRELGHSENDAHRLLRADTWKRSDEAMDAAARDLIWDEYTRLGGTRDLIHVNAREDKVELYENIFNRLINQFPDIDVARLEKARNAASVNRALDYTDETEFAINRIIKISDDAPVPEAGKNLSDFFLPTINGANSEHRAIYEATSEMKKLFSKIEQSATENWAGKIAVNLDPKKAEGLNKLVPKLKEHMVVSKSIAMDTATHARDFALLNYGDRINLDVMASYVLPYQFWYSRTYANWLKRIVQNPAILAGYAKYRDALEKQHAGYPDWYKYNLNTNELLGLDSENPLFFNLESTINPLNGLLAIDFNDPDRQRTGFSTFIDQIGKFGPSVWTPITVATGLSFYINGDPEAGSAWIGRTIPVTSGIKGLTKMAGITGTGRVLTPGGLELDPAIILQGGLGKYDRSRVGRELAAMRGEYPEEQLVEAINNPQSPLYQEAWSRAEARRAPSNALSSILGTGYKGRTKEDVLIDKFYSELRAIQTRAPDLSPDEYRKMYTNLYEKYPFGNLLLMTRTNIDERDQALAYNVLSRLPPGDTYTYIEQAGIRSELLEKFYDDKGKISKWSEPDRLEFMAGIKALSVVIATPPDTLKHEWNYAKAEYSIMNTEAKGIYGDDILTKVFTYYSYKDDSNKANDFLNQHPEISEYLNWKASYVLGNPILNKYYGGVDTLENLLYSEMKTEAKQKFGQDILTTSYIYGKIKEQGGDTRRFLADNPILKEYWQFREEYENRIGKELEDSASLFPEKPEAIVRPDADLTSKVAKDIMSGFVDAEDPQVDARIAAYSNPTETDFSLTDYIDIQSEKMWPGITKKQLEFDRLRAGNIALAEIYFKQNKDLQQKIAWEKMVRKSYSDAEKGKFNDTMTRQEWINLFGSEQIYNLVVSEDNLPREIMDYLDSIAEGMGISTETLISMAK